MNLKLARNVTVAECHWLVRDFSEGEVLHRYLGFTYGCMSRNGIACSLTKEGPFFEIPKDAVAEINQEQPQ